RHLLRTRLLRQDTATRDGRRKPAGRAALRRHIAAVGKPVPRQSCGHRGHSLMVSGGCGIAGRIRVKRRYFLGSMTAAFAGAAAIPHLAAAQEPALETAPEPTPDPFGFEEV